TLINGRERGENQWNSEPIRADADFKKTVKPERMRNAFGASTKIKTAEREAAHERSEHGADGEGGCAKHQHQLADPDHLVHEPADAGEKKAKENDPGSTVAVSGSYCLWFGHPI